MSAATRDEPHRTAIYATALTAFFAIAGIAVVDPILPVIGTSLGASTWQIELLFRWIKQHLDIRKFLGNNENAIRLQVLAAMIAYLLLRIGARLHSVKIPLLRLAELVGQSLFTRKTFHRIDRPPPVNPSKPSPKVPANQMAFCYA